MLPYPESPDTFLSQPRTEGELQAWYQAWMDASKGYPGGRPESTLTISGGTITPPGAPSPSGGVHAVGTEGGAATDDLTNIDQTNTSDGRLLFLHAAAAGQVPTIKHDVGGAGTVKLQGNVDLVLDRVDLYVQLQRLGTTWQEVFRTGAGIKVYDGEADKVALANNGTLTFTHNLGAEPHNVVCVLECTTADAGYSVGAKIMMSAMTASGTNNGLGVEFSATEIKFHVAVSGIVYARGATPFTMATLVAANWTIKPVATRG